MKGDYPNDTFTEDDVLSCLEGAGLRYKRGHRYILTQCPTHEDANPSAQIYKDDWFVNCHAGCGRFHITKAFPLLRFRGDPTSPMADAGRYGSAKPRQASKDSQNKMSTYKIQDLMEQWKKMPLIPRDHYFKNIPLEVLDSLGWRWDEPKNSYFIPYFNATRTQIPFAQWRHLSGDRRFTMLKDAQPIAYGMWNCQNNPVLFVVEGTSDCAVMEHCNVPWVGMPSASSGTILGALAGFCKQNGVVLVFAGDNDSAGLRLGQTLDGVCEYRVRQPRQPYKDWGDMYEAEGADSIFEYCQGEIFQDQFPQQYPTTKDEAEVIMRVFPGSKKVQLKIVGSQEKSKEQFAGEPTLLY